MSRATAKNLLATTLNLAGRRINAGTGVDGLTARALGVRTVGEAVRHAQATLAQPPTLDNLVRYTKATQDCSNLDLAILGHLRDGGIPLMFVCDPDQAIYEFRGAQPEEVRAFGATLAHTIELTGNWRSSPAICRLAATLRPDRHARPADVPIGRYHDDPTPVLLITAGDSERTLTTFTDHAQRLDIADNERLVLAHAGNKLPQQSPRHEPAAHRRSRPSRLRSRHARRPAPHPAPARHRV